jgi:C1A family cysteine protease
MVKGLIALATLASAEPEVNGGTLNLTWEDCGDATYHGKISGIDKTSITLGEQTTVTGSGTVDEAVAGGDFTISAKAGPITQKYSGKVCEAKEFDLPLGLGKVNWQGLSCPAAAGDLSVAVGIKLASIIPSSMAKADVSVTATGSSADDKLLCMTLHTAPAVAAGSAWEDFKAKYGKYYNGADEDAKRHQIFDANVEFINAENAKGHSYTLGVGPFADLTAEEFTATRLGYKQTESDEPVLDVHQWEGEELADSLDWSTKGMVTDIKDQGQCGSCWAFSTTGALESGYAISSGKLVSLSEQQYVDCDGLPNLGCMGGQMSSALKWAEKHDLCTEESYPYTAKGGLLSSCKSKGCTVGMKSGSVTGVKNLNNCQDTDLKSALQGQPISIAIQANQNIFQHYTGGVITGSCGTNTDHGVLLVGYGTDGGDDYWKVKNSWGNSWGEAGFVRLVQGKNQCGINSGPNFPVFSASVSV